MTFEQAKDQVAKEEGYKYWTAMENSSDVSWARLLQCSEDAGKLYARSKWDEACKLQRDNCFDSFWDYSCKNIHDEDGFRDSIKEAKQPEFKP